MKKLLTVIFFAPVFLFGQTFSNHQEISNFIINYYLKSPLDEANVFFQMEASDQGITLSAYDSENRNDEFPIPLNTVNIPSSEYFIKGDINGDLKEDILATVGQEFGASGYSYDLFIFLSKGNTYFFHKLYDCSDLNKCPQDGTIPGDFIPEYIKSSVIYGTASCFMEEDPLCCPSLNYQVEYIFSNGLIVKKQELKMDQ